MSRRTREVGIRMSIGACRADVCRMFVRESLSLSLIGVVVGLVIGAAASRLMTACLFGLSATNVLTFVGASVILCLGAAIASFIRARRAARVDPLVALRYD